MPKLTGPGRRPSHALLACYAVCAVGGLTVVALTRYSPEHAALLGQSTSEQGVFEVLSVVCLVLIGLRALREIPRHTAWLVPASLALLAAGEEASWGQHWLGFEPPEWLAAANRQGEANLHNLVDPSWFSFLVHAPVNVALVILPLALRLSRGSVPQPWNRWLPDQHGVLVFLMAWAFHGWGLSATRPDSLMFLAVLAAAGLAAFRLGERSERLHWILVASGAAVLAACHGVYRYENMQYEIRELLVVLGLAYWLAGIAARAGPGAKGLSHA